MVFFWVILYGLTHSLSQCLSQALHLPITAAAMAGYIIFLFAYLLHTGRARQLALQWPANMRLHAFLPLLALPLCNLLYAQHGQSDWYTMIILICAAIAEELFFRGFLLLRLPLRHPSALFISSLAFALLHAANLVSAPVQIVFSQIISAFFFGFCAGAVTLQYKSLLPALAAHLLINLTGAQAALPSYALAACIVIHTIYGFLLCSRLRRS